MPVLLHGGAFVTLRAVAAVYRMLHYSWGPHYADSDSGLQTSHGSPPRSFFEPPLTVLVIDPCRRIARVTMLMIYVMGDGIQGDGEAAHSIQSCGRLF